MRDSSIRRMLLTLGTLSLLLNSVPMLHCQTEGGRVSARETFGIRVGAGTDLNLGLGVGGGVFYLWKPAGGGPAFELGADGYYHHSTDPYTDQRGSVTVKGEDKTTLIVFGVRANALFNFSPSRRSVYFILGVGFVVASLQWEENENAPNWIRPYHDEVQATSAGNIFNLGIGIPLGSALDIRLETPMLYFYSSAGKSAAFAPTATLGLTYRFN